MDNKKGGYYLFSDTDVQAEHQTARPLCVARSPGSGIANTTRGPTRVRRSNLSFPLVFSTPPEPECL
jgi:hypothetical protein